MKNPAFWRGRGSGCDFGGALWLAGGARLWATRVERADPRETSRDRRDGGGVGVVRRCEDP